jgi:mannitol/fructose-specific phosphotransferase system IIA component (Ntr-type)
MNKHINQLLQIQDMELALSVNDVIHKNKETEEIGQKLLSDIAEMKKSLPSEVQHELSRISPKYELFVVPMLNDCCTGCFIKLPVGIANNIKNPNECVFCPNCHRYLYHDEKPIARPDNNMHYKGIARFSSVNLMFPSLKSKTHADAIEEIGLLMSKTGFVKCGNELSTALLKREALCSTAVGSGIAFPHARGVQACGLTLAIAIVPEGIDFGDGETVKLLFVSAVPIQTSVFYMELVSKIARYFSKEENINKLLACKTAEEMWKIVVTIGK